MCGVERTPEEAVKLVYGECKKTCGETSRSSIYQMCAPFLFQVDTFLETLTTQDYF